MMMNKMLNELMFQFPTFLLVFCVGIILGAIFFGGLWWTVKKMQTVKRPALWFIVSFLARAMITLSGFYWVGEGEWLRLMLCILGFIVARFVIILMTNSNANDIKNNSAIAAASEISTSGSHATLGEKTPYAS
jgi:F1F0 ATPase subunit 2